MPRSQNDSDTTTEPAEQEPTVVTAPAAEPDAPELVVSNTASAPVDPGPATEYVADGPIFINGVRAYNDGDPVTAAAVESNNLQKFVKKA